jgi:hypothetical protein
MDARRYAAKLLILRGLRRSCQRADAAGETYDAIILADDAEDFIVPAVCTRRSTHSKEDV